MSTSLFDALGPVLSGRNVSQVASALDIDERQAASALQVALPALVTALQRNAASRDGLASLTGALDRNHDGSVLDANHDGSAADDLVRMAGGLSDLFAGR